MNWSRSYKNWKACIELTSINGRISNQKSATVKIWLTNVRIDCCKVHRSFLLVSRSPSVGYVLEFDVWYNECYLNGNTTGGANGPAGSGKPNDDYRHYNDAAERFESMQKELLLSDLDSMPFRQAQMRTNRRVSSARLHSLVVFRDRVWLLFSLSMYSIRPRLNQHGNKVHRPQLFEWTAIHLTLAIMLKISKGFHRYPSMVVDKNRWFDKPWILFSLFCLLSEVCWTEREREWTEIN